jgi:hypothetical protein
MKTTFVNLKSELTDIKESCKRIGFEVFRTRLTCACNPDKNSRDGIVVVSNNQLIARAIRCKACAKTPKSPEGDLKGGSL